jgi:membrane carboxypeptidase/penicillin-binding protein
MRRGYAGDVAVPMWTAFMKEATKGDPATWLDTPDNLGRVAICRVSGLRAGDGCEAVRVATNDEGSYDVRSMVFAEYFVRGTAPADTCDLHRPVSVFNRFVGWFKR